MTETGAASRELLKKAMDQHRAGDLQSARDLYREHLENRPGDVHAMCLLAALEGQSGDHRAAEDAYRQAIAADPACGPAHGGLGISLLMQQRSGDAAEALEEAVSLMPDEMELRQQLALALQLSGRLPQARATLETLVERWPDHLPGRHNLGLLLLQTGEPDAAVQHLRFVVDREPRRHASWIALARALKAANELADAEEALTRARKLAPEDPEQRILFGDLLRARGKYPESEREYQAVLGARPGDAAAMMGLAELDLSAGRPGRALERLAPFIHSDQPSPAAIRLAARALLANGDAAEAVRNIDRWLAAPDLSPPVRGALFSIKGRALDELGDTEGAWLAWSEAHAQRPSRFDGSHFSYAVDQLATAFGQQLYGGRSTGDTCWPAEPVLIVGTPRCGKSALEQALACHPAIRGAGELRCLGSMTQEIARRAGTSERPYPSCVEDLNDSDLEDLAELYRTTMERQADGARWVVDTQPTNFLHIGLAALLRPGIRVIFCRRDPIDTGWACFSTHFADPGLDFVSSPQGIAQYLGGMLKLMKHWESSTPARILEIHYEDLVRLPRETLGKALHHLDLDWDESVMEYLRPGMPDLALAPVLKRPLDDREVGRGAAYRDKFPDLTRLLSEGDHVR